MNDLAAWASALRSRTSRRDVAEIFCREGRIEVAVWREAAAKALRATAAELGIPDDLLHVTRPLTFLDPYPGDDERNRRAFDEFVREHVQMVTPDAGMLISGLAPLVRPDARLIILGSMPGEYSISRGEYYAHRHNRFWRVLGSIIGFDSSAEYHARAEALTSAGIALWDVLKHCSRIGSLNRAIDVDTEVPNDFASFFHEYPTIQRVVFNGRKAAGSYRRLVAPALTQQPGTVQLPSTSGANTRVAFRELLAIWRAVLE